MNRRNDAEIADMPFLRRSLEQHRKTAVKRGRTLKRDAVFRNGGEQLPGERGGILHRRQVIRLTAAHADRLRQNVIGGK